MEEKDTAKVREFRDNKLFNAKIELDNLIAQLEKEYPTYYDLKYNVKTVELETLQSKLSPETIMLEYAVSEEGDLWVFAIDQKEIHCIKEKLPDTYKEEIKEFHDLSQNFFILRSKNKNRFVELGHTLYNYFIKPVEEHLIERNKLIIIVEGQLNYLPFEILLKNNNDKEFSELDYLLKDFDISYHYSATLYERHLSGNKTHEQNLLAFAPVFAGCI